jgi:eukaryotic-like serine/threonine-protein kinase
VSCPDDNVLAALLDHSIGADALAVLEQHLDTCDRCRTVAALAVGSHRSALGSTSPAVAELSRDPEGLEGTTIDDRYRVMSPLGRGGMGTVYLARDIELGRDVAVKVHRVGSDEARLKREAVAMAQLAHPNVVTVFEVGAIDQATYVAMEYVRGTTLREWIAARRRPWRAVLAMLIDAGQGLAAAHAAGLVHRDFKPQNVLVGDDERPRVSDFGLVRVDATSIEEVQRAVGISIEATQAGSVVGTPAYMAPEQFEQPDVDARCDQYAFCAVAWEGLFGRRPFDGKTFEELHAAVARHELAPAPPSAVPDRVRRVLERGLAKAPSDRYPDMPTLLAALRRASAPRWRQRVSVAAVIAVVGIGAVGWRHASADGPCSAPSLGASWNVPQRLAVQAAFLWTGLPYADGAWTRAQQSLDQFATRWSAQGRDACLAYDVNHTDDSELHAARTACLDQGEQVFASVVDRLGEAATDRSVAAQAAQLVDVLPDLDACVRPSRSERVEPASRAQHVAFFTDLARVQSLVWAGHIEDAARGLDALAQAAHALGSKRADVDVGFLTGKVAELRGHSGDATQAYEHALWTAESIGYDERVAATALELLHVYGQQARDADAQRYRELARSAAERVGTPTARSRAARAIGKADLLAGRFDPAEHELTDALELARSRVPVDDYDVAAVLTDLGDLYYRRGQLPKAETVQREAIGLFAHAVGPDNPANGAALNNYGNTLADLGHNDEAADAYRRALAIRERVLGPDHPEVAQTLSNAAGIAAQQGKLDDARRDLDRALAIDEKALGPNHPSLAHVLFNLGELARMQGQLADAQGFHDRALALRRKTLGDHHPQVTESELALSQIALAQHDLAGARSECDAARESIKTSDAHNDELAASLDTCFGAVALESGQLATAAPLFEHALQLQSKGGGDPGALAVTRLALARALPASAASRALELARAARTELAQEGVFRKEELAEADRWLAAHRGK